MHRFTVVTSMIIFLIIGSLSNPTAEAQVVMDSTIKVTNVEFAYPFWSPDGSRMSCNPM